MFCPGLLRFISPSSTLQFQRYVRAGRKRFDNFAPSSATSENSADQPKPQPKHKVTSLLDDAVTDYLKLETAEGQDPWSKPPYPLNALKYPAEPSLKSIRPKIDPRETSIILFPGQGAQYVGMAKHLLDYPNVKDLFYRASDILRYDLLKFCMEGPENELNRTVHCQPAIFVTSLAAVEKLKAKEPVVIHSCIATAGFSVGEIAALVFADAMSFEDGLRFIKTRAEAMQRASEAEPSGLMSVFVKADSRLKEALAAAVSFMKAKGHPQPVCQVANYLFTQCKVVGGHEAALKYIEDHASDYNLRCKRLPVSGAFHTPLMREAAELLKEDIRALKIVQPLIPVHSNIDGQIYDSVETIKKNLPKQVTSPVRWEQLMHILYSRDEGQYFPATYEMCPGRQLGVMLRKTNAKAAKYYNSMEEKEKTDGE